jgi:hypothetical protein
MFGSAINLTAGDSPPEQPWAQHRHRCCHRGARSAAAYRLVSSNPTVAETDVFGSAKSSGGRFQRSLKLVNKYTKTSAISE